MKVALILVVLAYDPTKLFNSIPDDAGLWIVYFHGKDLTLCNKVMRRVTAMGGIFEPMMTNRGLSRSWNDAIVQGLDAGCDAFLLLNDDLFFYEDGFDSFINFAEKAGEDDRTGPIYLTGREISGADSSEKIVSQGLSCGLLPKTLIEEIGFFDENFWPAYFEDVDFARRYKLACFEPATDERILVEHARSSTVLTDPVARQMVTHHHLINRDYLIRKWGPFDAWTHQRPFDDSRFDLRIRPEARHHPYDDHDQKYNPFKEAALAAERGRRSSSGDQIPVLSLDELGRLAGTDKSSIHHDYLSFYELHLREFRDKKFVLVEVGIYFGKSIAMWAKYFSRAHIVGIDHDIDTMKHRYLRNCTLLQGDGTAAEMAVLICEQFERPLIVVDDGSHKWAEQIATLRLFWPHMQPGGVYIIENIDTSFPDAAPEFSGLASISPFDYVFRLARWVTGFRYMTAETETDSFIEANWRSVRSLHLHRGTCLMIKK